ILFGSSQGVLPWTPTFSGLPAPHPGLLFPRRKSRQKGARGGTLSMGSLPCGPHPRDDTKGGARPPLDSPASSILVLLFYGNSRGCITRRMFRQTPKETSISLTGRQPKHR